MIHLNITITGGNIDDILNVDDRKIIAHEAARGVLIKTQSHLRSNGGRGWWSSAAKSTELLSWDDHSASVGIYQRGVALQRYGSAGLPNGRVVPTHSKYLCLPVDGGKKSPRDFRGKLIFIPSRGDSDQYAGKLVAPVPGKKETKGEKAQKQKYQVLFICLRWTVHMPHPPVLPADDELADEAQYAASMAATKLTNSYNK